MNKVKAITALTVCLLIGTLFLSSCSSAIEQEESANTTSYQYESVNTVDYTTDNILNTIPHDEMSEADLDLLSGIYDFPESPWSFAQGRYDLLSIIQSGQYGITWIMNKDLPDGFENYLPNPDWSIFEYPVFDDFPNTEFTDVINQAISDFVFQYYYGFLYNLEQGAEHRFHPTFGSRAEVIFANPQLVSIYISAGVTFYRSQGRHTTFNFNPTTGDLYRLYNFVDITPEFMAALFGERILEDESTLEARMDSVRYHHMIFTEDGIEVFRPTDSMVFQLTYEELVPFLFTDN